MKRFPIALVLLMTFLTMLVIYTLGHAVTNKAVLQIDGMTCGAWPLVIKKALEGLDGVEKVSISFKRKRGEVFFDPDKVSENEIVNKVNQIGFKAKVIQQKID